MPQVQPLSQQSRSWQPTQIRMQVSDCQYLYSAFLKIHLLWSKIISLHTDCLVLDPILYGRFLDFPPLPHLLIRLSFYHSLSLALKKLRDPIMDRILLPVPGLPFAEMIRVSMFKMNIGKGRGVSERMFQLNLDQQRIVRKNLALPKITSWINQCINENNFDDGAKGAYMKLIREYNITYVCNLLCGISARDHAE